MQTLAIWGTVGLEGGRGAGGRLMGGVKGSSGTAKLGVGFGAVSGHVVLGRLSKGKEHMVDTSTAHMSYVCGTGLTHS